MIEVQNLTKRYGAKTAVDNISFSVAGGEILGFLGPNGAGKTTTMNIITGYLSSNEGTVTVGGSEILAEPIKVKSQIGYLPELPPLYMDMTVREYLGFLFDLKKVKGKKKSQVDEVCERVHIDDVKNRLIKNLSKGYRQRVGLAQALLGNPPVLILDEPTIGLDPKQIIEMRNLILELGLQHTIVLSSHILSEIQAVCKRIIIIHQGALVADGTPEAISQSLSGASRLNIRVAGPYT
ncbi:MAG: ABC transporter ATP-binding protein, partial [Clostridiales bacterium]|nr:ABC transporter ATP-binding protein [Clostridiales bacterium]